MNVVCSIRAHFTLFKIVLLVAITHKFSIPIDNYSFLDVEIFFAPSYGVYISHVCVKTYSILKKYLYSWKMTNVLTKP